MLKKRNRLLTNFEFRTTRRYGKSFSSKYFQLFYLFRGDEETRDKRQEDSGFASKAPTKVGIVVSKKLSKKAVVRNRIKRVFREIVRRNFDKIKPGFWIVVQPKRKSLETDYEKINTEFTKILQKAPFSKDL